MSRPEHYGQRDFAPAPYNYSQPPPRDSFDYRDAGGRAPQYEDMRPREYAPEPAYGGGPMYGGDERPRDDYRGYQNQYDAPQGYRAGEDQGQNKRPRYDNYEQAPRHDQAYPPRQDYRSAPSGSYQADLVRPGFQQPARDQNYPDRGRRSDLHQSEPDYRRRPDYDRDYNDSDRRSSYNDSRPERRQRELSDPPGVNQTGPGGSPSASVLLLGIPAHVTDRILRIFLEDMGASIDTTTVIMDRATGLSKKYGFAKFVSVEHARAFLEPNFPVISWRDPDPAMAAVHDGTKLKLYYSQKPGGWRDDQNAAARAAEEQRHGGHSGGDGRPMYVNDGTRDIGSTPCSTLLLRGLDPLTKEEDIVASLVLAPAKGKSPRIKAEYIERVMITRDKVTRGSWGFAFVQFTNNDYARLALSNLLNHKLFPTGFKMRSSVIAFSFAHENSFIPIYAPSEWAFKAIAGHQVTYWDDKAYVRAWEPAPRPSAASDSVKPTSSAATASGSKGDGVAKNGDPDADMEAFFSSIEAEVPLFALGAPPLADAPTLTPATATSAVPASVLAAFSKPPPTGPATLVAPPLAARISTVASPHAPFPLAPGGAMSTVDADDKLKASLKTKRSKEVDSGPAGLGEDKKKNALIETKKAAVNITKWNTKQLELKEPAGSAAAPSAPIPAPTAPAPSAATTVSTSDSTTLSEEMLIFADARTKVCLLCQRQFKDIPGLHKHTSLSALHTTNLASATTVAEAHLRKLAIKSIPEVIVVEEPDTTKYVDRAAARRETFNQPEQPSAAASRTKRHLPAPPAPPPAPISPNQNGIEESNVGSKMLAKMGWAKGTGLGSEGTGITAPVLATSLQQGAGLGATKGVVVGTYEPTRKGYAQQLRDAAKDRMNE